MILCLQKFIFFLFNVKKITTNVSVKIGGDKMKDLSLLCDSFKVCLLKAVAVTSITLSERCPLSATWCIILENFRTISLDPNQNYSQNCPVFNWWQWEDEFEYLSVAFKTSGWDAKGDSISRASFSISEDEESHVNGFPVNS